MNKLVTPNCLQLVQKELATIKVFENNFVVPTQITETKDANGNDNHYHFVCVRLSDVGADKDKVRRGKHIAISINQYNKIQRQIKNGVIKQMFGGTWHSVYVLHNPTLKPAPQTEEIKDLSPTQKSKVKAMMEEGKGQDDEGLKEIGKALNISFKRLKLYIGSGVN